MQILDSQKKISMFHIASTDLKQPLTIIKEATGQGSFLSMQQLFNQSSRTRDVDAQFPCIVRTTKSINLTNLSKMMD